MENLEKILTWGVLVSAIIIIGVLLYNPEVATHMNILSQPKINLDSFNVQTGFDLNLGAYADCNVQLSNTGDADGIVSLSLEADTGKVLNAFDVFVPKHDMVRRTVRADISIQDKGIICRPTKVRKA